MVSRCYHNLNVTHTVSLKYLIAGRYDILWTFLISDSLNRKNMGNVVHAQTRRNATPFLAERRLATPEWRLALHCDVTLAAHVTSGRAARTSVVTRHSSPYPPPTLLHDIAREYFVLR